VKLYVHVELKENGNLTLDILIVFTVIKGMQY
jgi:hypothetical protein